MKQLSDEQQRISRIVAEKIKKALGKDVLDYAVQLSFLEFSHKGVMVDPSIIERAIFTSICTLITEGKLILREVDHE